MNLDHILDTFNLSDEDMLRCQLPCRKASEIYSASASSRSDWTATMISDDDFRKLIEAEEQKRNRNWDAAERWRVFQDTITWAEAQATVRRNTPARCLELQRAKLARLG